MGQMTCESWTIMPQTTAEDKSVVQWCSSMATPRVSNIELVILGRSPVLSLSRGGGRDGGE